MSCNWVISGHTMYTIVLAKLLSLFMFGVSILYEWRGCWLRRKQRGVWSELGKPFTCLGVPNLHASRDPPMPEPPYGADSFDKLKNFDFFPVPPVTNEQREQMAAAAEEAQMSPSKRRRAQQLKHSQAASEMDRMLTIMGLLFFHGAYLLHSQI